MIAEYGQISMRKPQTVMKVIRGEDSKRYGESCFKAEEEGCHICGIPGHFYKSCKHFNRKYSLEQNKRYYQKKHKGQTEDVKAGDSRPTGGGGPAGGSGRPSGEGQGRRQGNSSNSNSASSSEPPTEQARYAREL